MNSEGLGPLTGLPTDGQSILSLAARSLFDVFANASEGMLLVDRSGRVVWINDHYRRYLPALGFEKEEDFVGRPVVEVVQNTQMGQVMETGKPILIDLLTNRAGTFLVSRFPLRDDAGVVIGALGVVLFEQPETNLKPLMAKFALMQRELDEARNALAAQRRTGPALRQARHSFASFVGASSVVADLKRQARRAAQTHSPVLLLGETGTGKELLAHAIHASSPRARGPLVSINIAAVPETLLEAEFFGVAPGAFTGADRKGREGKFKLADGGTLFLDEIGDMPLGLQAKLLRALQEGEVEPLGSNQLMPFDVRVIAATSRDLTQLVREGLFREDLYYRLNVLPLRVPALRDRASDIPHLIEVLSEELALRNAVPQPEFQSEAVALLSAQPFRGNVRELRNVIEQLLLRCETGLVDAAAVEAVLRESGLSQIVPAHKELAGSRPMGFALTDHTLSAEQWALAPRMRALEVQAVQEALRQTRGNKAAAAHLLGISRAKLYQCLS
ncbi:sigma-54 interaction domain-containing protein [Limnohabitans sp. 63ED37-2]|uniref:sigma-54 interaction domain-containing protein n=1 Tax=Limnohabitans sp. 63ED37-2 TaxID=1678128 RepID=UPI000706828E|nr:sigma 54-interacting transcriptional regulator [Limnohabitans sp. 63ED37-2]ALK88678.1 Nitrogen assimilation regulatory protein [Limnohabitans sp. 63ED37-2]